MPPWRSPHSLYMYVTLAAPASAMQVLEAADHAAQVPAGGVVRIALGHDRIARVIRGADGFAVEHDPGDLDLFAVEDRAQLLAV